MSLLGAGKLGALISKLISAVQEEIKAADPDSHYAKTYWKHETGYWRGIPSWIVADYHGGREISALDIGAAYGTLSIFCKKALGCRVTALDYRDYYFRESLRRKYKIGLVHANIQTESITFPELFDFVILTEVLEHFNFDPVLTLRQIRSYMKPGGRLYLSTPDGTTHRKPRSTIRHYRELPLPVAGAKYVDGHIHHYRRGELQSLLRCAGFRIERFELPDKEAGATKIRLSAINRERNESP